MRWGAITLAVAAALLPVAAAGQDAATFRGDLAHTGVYRTAGVTHAPTLKWKFQTRGAVISSPAIANGTVYAGSTDGFLYALDAGSGHLRWKYRTGTRVTSSPAVSGGLVYFNSYDGSFYALNAQDGSLAWKFKTAGERRFAAPHLHGASPDTEVMPDPFDIYLSSPAIFDGAVYFGSGDRNVYALDAKTGARKWAFKTGNVVHASPAIEGETVYIGSWDRNFYALDAATGKERWHFTTGDDQEIHNQVGIQSSASVANGIVYFGCRDSHLYALDAASGKLKWSFPTHGSWVIASPAFDRGKVYFATSDTGLFYQVDAASGKLGFSLSFNHWPMFSSPAIVGTMAYIGSHSGKLRAIDLDGKKVAWTFVTDGAKRNGATYTNPDGSPNYRAAYKGNFYDDMVVGGAKLMSVGAIYSSPVIVDGVIYFGSTDGYLYALS